MSKPRLYQLVDKTGRGSSPFVWRIRYALLHKGIDYDLVPVHYSDIPKIGNGKFKTVPILEKDGRFVSQSRAIAEWLDVAYPKLPPLFASPAEFAMVAFFDKWFGTTIMPPMFKSCVAEIFQLIPEAQQQYFRSTRERDLGETIEAIGARSDGYLQSLRSALLPLRLALRRTAYIGGDWPNYADYIAWGCFAAFSPVAKCKLLADDDPLLRWVHRGYELMGGIPCDWALR